MSTWLSKMNNGGMRGGMKVKNPILPGLNTSAAKVSKTKAVDAAKIAADGDKADKEAETNSNNSFANKLKADQIAKEGQGDLDNADAAQVADTSYITESEPKKKATMTSNLKPIPKKKHQEDNTYRKHGEMTTPNPPEKVKGKKKHQEETPPSPKPSGGKIAPVIVAAAINAISKKKK